MLALAARSGQGCAWLRSRRARKSAAVLTALARRSVQMLSGRGAPRTLVATRSPRGVEQGALMPVQSRRRRLPYGGRPHKLDQVLGLTAGAVEAVIDPLGAAMGEAGHHVANVQALCRRLDPGCDPALGGPGFGAIPGLGVAAQQRGACSGPAPPHVIRGGLDQATQPVIAGQAEDEIDAAGLAPLHHLGPPIMAVAADGDVG